MARWIDFVENPLPPGRKTSTWTVVSKDGSFVLGQISWFGRWRCFSFYPSPNTVFEERCLRDIATFCALLTQRHASEVAERQIKRDWSDDREPRELREPPPESEPVPRDSLQISGDGASGEPGRETRREG